MYLCEYLTKDQKHLDVAVVFLNVKIQHRHAIRKYKLFRIYSENTLCRHMTRKMKDQVIVSTSNTIM